MNISIKSLSVLHISSILSVSKHHYSSFVTVEKLNSQKLWLFSLMFQSFGSCINIRKSIFSHSLFSQIVVNNEYFSGFKSPISVNGTKERITIDQCMFSSIFSSNQCGSAIMVNSSESILSITNSFFNNCSSSDSAGAISALCLSLNIDHSCLYQCFTQNRGNAAILICSSPFFDNKLGFSTILGCSGYERMVGMDSFTMFSGNQRIVQSNFSNNYCSPLKHNIGGPCFDSSFSFFASFDTIYNSTGISVLMASNCQSGCIEFSNFAKNNAYFGLISLKLVFTSTLNGCYFYDNSGSIFLLVNSSNMLINCESNMDISIEYMDNRNVLRGKFGFNTLTIEHLNSAECRFKTESVPNYILSKELFYGIGAFCLGFVIAIIGLYCRKAINNTRVLTPQEERILEMLNQVPDVEETETN